MKLIRTEEAAGHVLCHDLTQIIPGITKDAIFRKGHVITEKDIPVLLSIGKEHLYIWEKTKGMLHENEAAQILGDLCKNENMITSDPKEGKIELFADKDGLLKINSDKLNQINALGEIMIASRHGNTPVKAGDKLAGTRVIPLLIEEEKMNEAKKIAGNEPLLSILPFTHKKASIINTGSEIYKGRIKDAFGPVIRAKLEEYNVEIISQTIVDDSMEMIRDTIKKDIANGAELVLCTGGMSVDPDDRTPAAIRDAGSKVISYGAPVLPGAMFMLAYVNDEIPILGLPGCVMYAKRTIFDLVLPRVLANEKLTKQDISILGEGGLCLSCDICTYPNCGFGK